MNEVDKFGRDLMIGLISIPVFLFLLFIPLYINKMNKDQAYNQAFRNLKTETITVKVIDKKMISTPYRSGKHQYGFKNHYLIYTPNETLRNEEGQSSDTIFANIEPNKEYTFLVRQLDVGSEYRTILEIKETAR